MEDMTYILVSEAPVDYPAVEGSYSDLEAAEAVRDELAAVDSEVAYMVMTEAEYDEYVADFF